MMHNLPCQLRFTVVAGIAILCSVSMKVTAQNLYRAGCVTAGPGIEASVRYIHDTLANQPTNSPETYLDISRDNKQLLYHSTFEYRDSNSGVLERYPIAALDCEAMSALGGGGSINITARCERGRACGRQMFEHADDTETFVTTVQGFTLYADTDETGQRLARAVSHLIYLLQEQYKKQYPVVNDPFAEK